MDTSLQNTGVDEQTLPVVVEGEEEPIGEVGHIHLPGPSIWPIILSVAIAIAMLGFLIIDTTPWVVIISLPLMLIGALGWALEDPMKGSHEQEVEPGKYARTFGEARLPASRHLLLKSFFRKPKTWLIRLSRSVAPPGARTRSRSLWSAKARFSRSTVRSNWKRKSRKSKGTCAISPACWT